MNTKYAAPFTADERSEIGNKRSASMATLIGTVAQTLHIGLPMLRIVPPAVLTEGIVAGIVKTAAVLAEAGATDEEATLDLFAEARKATAALSNPPYADMAEAVMDFTDGRGIPAEAIATVREVLDETRRDAVSPADAVDRFLSELGDGS